MKGKVSDLPIMKVPCSTCPFKLVGGKYQNMELANAVTERTLFKAQQTCHTVDDTQRCRGSYDFNKTIYDRMGLGHLLK